MPAESVSSRNLLPDSQMVVFLLCSYMAKGALWDLFYKSTIPFMRALPFWPDNFSKAPPPNTITLRIKLQHMISGETHLQQISVSLSTIDISLKLLLRCIFHRLKCAELMCTVWWILKKVYTNFYHAERFSHPFVLSTPSLKGDPILFLSL